MKSVAVCAVVSCVCFSLKPAFSEEGETALALASSCRLPSDADAFSATLRVNVETKTGENTTQTLRYQWKRENGGNLVGTATLRQGKTSVRLRRRKQEGDGPLVLDIVPAAMAEWIENLVLFHPTADHDYEFTLLNKFEKGAQMSFNLARQGRAGVVNEPLSSAVISGTMESGHCRITRAVYAIAPRARAIKKVFFQWQEASGMRVPKRIHVEDTQTLDRYIFSFEDVVLNNTDAK